MVKVIQDLFLLLKGSSKIMSDALIVAHKKGDAFVLPYTKNGTRRGELSSPRGLIGYTSLRLFLIFSYVDEIN